MPLWLKFILLGIAVLLIGWLLFKEFLDVSGLNDED